MPGEIKVLTDPVFLRSAKKLMADEELAEFKSYISRNPFAGQVIQGTGGVRKIRWASGGKGKSGGVRVIYFLVNKASQIILFDIYSKSEKDNITGAERNELKKITTAYKRSERRKQ